MNKHGTVLAILLGLLAAAPAWAQSPAPSAASPGKATAPAAAAPAPAPSVPAAAPKAPLIDINTAAKEELDALPGIGAVRSEAIIKGRPYKGKDELLRKKVLPSNIYNGIKDRIIAKQS